jgi:CO dehydrogenase nickel-insertion accessory protein CooC1
MIKSSGNGSGRTSIHIALQGKGGVGKSLISAILSQYLSSRGQDVHGIDADPVNQTFSEYGGLAVECLNLLKEGSVDQRQFDASPSYVITEALKLLFRKDDDFRRWADHHTNNHNNEKARGEVLAKAV